MATPTIEFDQATQSLEALNAAAYRLLGSAICKIDPIGTKYVVSVAPSAAASTDVDDLGRRFMATVIDENVRQQIAQRTEPVRNLILALAFGSLAHPMSDNS
jgi:His-Xaa-Ser system protein HxsD